VFLSNREIEEIFATHIVKKMPESIDEKVLYDAVQIDIQSIQSAMPTLLERITSFLIDKCSESIKVRNIPR
jgi:aspartate oxidase